MKWISGAIVLLTALGLGAAPTGAASVLGGVEGGLSIANLTGDDVFNNSTKVGGAAGIFGRYTWTDVFAVQPEALWTMKGAQYEAQGTQTQQTIHYIEIPVLMRATWPRTGALRPSVLAGPALGILLSNKIQDGAEIDLKDASNTFDFGLVFGAGLEYALDKSCLLLDARYELGLTSTTKSSVDTSVKNSVFTILAGYGMRF
jgi:hypothetical protein